METQSRNQPIHLPKPPSGGPKNAAPSSPKGGSGQVGNSPRKDRESTVRHMLLLRIAGIYRRLLREKLAAHQIDLDEKGGSSSIANSVEEQRNALSVVLNQWMERANKRNTTDKLIVPTDVELLGIAAALVDSLALPEAKRSGRGVSSPKGPAAPPPVVGKKPPSAPQTARAGPAVDPQSAAKLLPELPRTPRGTSTNPTGQSLEAQGSKSPRLPPARIVEHPSIRHALQPPPAALNEQELLKEIQEEEEAAKHRHRTGIAKKRQADLWAQLSAFDTALYRESEQRRKELIEEKKRLLREALQQQVEWKKSTHEQEQKQYQAQLERDAQIQKEREQLEAQIEALRKQHHEAEKHELIQQMKEATLQRQKAELKAKLLDHQTKKLAAEQLAEEARRLQRKRELRKQIAAEATAENEAIRLQHEKFREEELEREKALIAESIAAAEEQERKRQHQKELVEEKIRLRTHLGKKLQDSLDEQAKQDAEKAEQELAKINAREAAAAKDKARRRSEAKAALRAALAAQMADHRKQHEEERQQGIREAEGTAKKVQEMMVFGEEQQRKKKQKIQQNRKDIQDQIRLKREKAEVEATRNMTDGEFALNRKKLQAMSEPRERAASTEGHSPTKYRPGTSPIVF